MSLMVYGRFVKGQADGGNQVSTLKFEGLSTAVSVCYQLRQVINAALFEFI